MSMFMILSGKLISCYDCCPNKNIMILIRNYVIVILLVIRLTSLNIIHGHSFSNLVYDQFMNRELIIINEQLS